jgi:hypothetical protein
MSDNNTLIRAINVDRVHEALNLAAFHYGSTVEDPEPQCEFSQLCDQGFCRFPRYSRDGLPAGLTANVLAGLGLPIEVLKDLDWEYEVGEVLHPGVKVARSRNAALRRIDEPGMALLAFLQDHQKVGWSWSKIAEQAFRPRWMIPRLDSRRRPWLY